MEQKVVIHNDFSTSIEYVPCVLRGNCWYPLPSHYAGSTPDKAKKLLGDYMRITKCLQEQNPGREIPIVETRILKRITTVSVDWEELNEWGI